MISGSQHSRGLSGRDAPGFRIPRASGIPIIIDCGSIPRIRRTPFLGTDGVWVLGGGVHVSTDGGRTFRSDLLRNVKVFYHRISAGNGAACPWLCETKG
jgi:hypothetical protein